MRSGLLHCLARIGVRFSVSLPVLFAFTGLHYFGSCLVSAQSTEPAGDALEIRRNATEAKQSSIEFGKALLRRGKNSVFVTWEFAKMPEQVKGYMAQRLVWIFPEELRPHKNTYPTHPIELKDGVVLAVRVAVADNADEYDLIEYEWLPHGRMIRVVASRNATRIDFALEELRSCRRDVHVNPCAKDARAWVESVIMLEGSQPGLGRQIDYRVDLPWPPELSDGTTFSSAPEKNIVRLRGWPQWWDRVDGFVKDGVLSILIYFKIGQLMGYPDGSKWFPEEFRELVKEERDRVKARG